MEAVIGAPSIHATPKEWGHFGLLTGAILAGTFLLDFLTPVGYVTWVPYFFAIMMSRYWQPRPRIIWWTTLAASALTMLDLWLGVPGQFQQGLFNRLLGLVLFATCGWICVRQQKVDSQLKQEIKQRLLYEEAQTALIAKLENALNDVKTLRGLIPICSHCKKIRGDQGFWQQVEVYIRDHSDVDFSHCICPECLEKHYGMYLRPAESQR